VLVGQWFPFLPAPLAPEDTEWIPAGAVRIGVEYRKVTIDDVPEAARHDPNLAAEIDRIKSNVGEALAGICLHVSGSLDDHEYLRFDCFEHDPHYHYIVRGDGGPRQERQRVVPFDQIANGKMLPWAIDRIRTNLPTMLRQVNGDIVADQIDPAVVAEAVNKAAALAEVALQRSHAA
jgi:hypothetical protein